MPMSKRFLLLPSALTILALVAGCTTAASPSSSAEPSVATSAAGSAASEEADPCVAENLETKQDGVLTIGTDNPAFPPYFDPPADDEEATDPWELGDPTNGRGFESAVAYAVAGELAFAEDQVEWTVTRFNQSFAPGEKDFDFYLAQVSYSDERAEAVDMSDGYFFVNQALVAREGSDIASATSIAEVAEYRLGAAVGTTSLSYIEEEIQPAQEPRVYDDNDGAIDGLNAGQVEGILVDLPTAFFITAVQMDDGVIVGQFPSADDGGEQEHFSQVLEKDSPITECVNTAIAALEESGDLEAITTEWMSENAGAPVLE